MMDSSTGPTKGGAVCLHSSTQYFNPEMPMSSQGFAVPVSMAPGSGLKPTA
jgi:hypothetical protein